MKNFQTLHLPFVSFLPIVKVDLGGNQLLVHGHGQLVHHHSYCWNHFCEWCCLWIIALIPFQVAFFLLVLVCSRDFDVPFKLPQLFRYRGSLVLYRLSCVTGEVKLLRSHDLITVAANEIVPGDVVFLSPGVIHCDMLLLTGEVVADESALTGEATPQSKVPIDPLSQVKYDPTLHKRQTLSAGTRIQECHKAIALVKNTASYTTKGELLREILAFRRHRVPIEVDLPIAVFFIVLYSLVCWFAVAFKSDSEGVVAWMLGTWVFLLVTS